MKKMSEREAERKEFLEEATKMIAGWEKIFEGTVLLNIFLHLLNKQLSSTGGTFANDDFPRVSQEKKLEALRIFCKVMGAIRVFQRSQEEQNALLAELLKWTANRIAESCYSALEKKEAPHPEPYPLPLAPVTTIRRLRLIHSRDAANSPS